MTKRVAVVIATALLIVACGDETGGVSPDPPVATTPTLSITLPPATTPPSIATTPTITEDQWWEIVVDSALLEVLVIDPFSQDLEGYWLDVSTRLGLEPARTSWSVTNVGSAPITTACADETGQLAVFGVQSGPIYCSLDDTIYLSSPYLSEYLKGHLNMPQAVSEVAAKAAMAHEKGHDLTFHFGWVEEWSKSNPDSVKPMELAADCLAGKALMGISQSPVFNNTGLVLDNQSIVDLIYDAVVSGDFLEENPGHHGTPRERATALLAGLTAGLDNYAPCMEYMGLTPAGG